MSFFRQFPKVNYYFSDPGFDTLVTDIFRFVQADLPTLGDSTTYQFYDIEDGDRPDIVSNKLYGTPDYYWTFFLCNEHLKTGLTGWPMSQLQFDKYIATEYDGTAIITYPAQPVYNTDGSEVRAHYNSLAGKFIIGEIISGGLVGNPTTGLLYKKDVNLSQLILKNVTGNPFSANQQIIGKDSGDDVYVGRVADWKDAPHHYLKKPIYDSSGNLLSEATISYNATFIDEQNPHAVPPVDNPPDVIDADLTKVTNLQYETELNDLRSKIRVIRPKMIYSFAQAYKKLLNA